MLQRAADGRVDADGEALPLRRRGLAAVHVVARRRQGAHVADDRRQRGSRRATSARTRRTKLNGDPERLGRRHERGEGLLRLRDGERAGDPLDRVGVARVDQDAERVPHAAQGQQHGQRHDERARRRLPRLAEVGDRVQPHPRAVQRRGHVRDVLGGLRVPHAVLQDGDGRHGQLRDQDRLAQRHVVQRRRAARLVDDVSSSASTARACSTTSSTTRASSTRTSRTRCTSASCSPRAT